MANRKRFMDAVVFLDVDGVLNDRNWCEKRQGELDPARIRILSEIVKSKKASIILSSTWKALKPVPGCPQDEETMRMWVYLNAVLKEQGLKITGCTPNLGPRPKEIHAWLQAHPEVRRVLILDDDYQKESYAEYGLEHHLLETMFFVPENSRGGLLPIHVPMAEKILESDYERKETL